MKLLLVCLAVCCVWSCVRGVRRPPQIAPGPRQVYFKSNEDFVIPCNATANPPATYTWRANGVDFSISGNDDRYTMISGVGTLLVRRPEEKDEANFQCFAENIYGRSASNLIIVREAVLDNFGPSEPPRIHAPALGTSLTLRCIPPRSVPPAQIVWVLRNPANGIVPIKESSRVTIDLEYNLHITNVAVDDEQYGNAYVCMASNKLVRQNMMGAENYVRPMGSAVQSSVGYLWASPRDTFGLRSKELRLKCIFSGNPTPVVTWRRVNHTELPSNSRLLSFGQELRFDSLDVTNEGDYECSATNSMSQVPVTRTVHVRVEAEPYWFTYPKNVEVGIGGAAFFECLAGGLPRPSVTWFINGVPLSGVADPRIDSRFRRISEEKVVFENVSYSDTMVIQCNVTNKHGYLWGDVYLNIRPDKESMQVSVGNNSIPVTSGILSLLLLMFCAVVMK